MPQNLKAVIPGKLYRSGSVAPQEIKMLYNPPYNIRRVVSLDQGVAQAIDPVLKQFRIEHIVIPINPGGDVTSALTVLRLAINRDILTIQNVAVLVHCARGMDRTGLAIALYRVKHGWGCDKAIAEAKSEGYGSGLNDSVKRAFDRIICTACKVSHVHVCKKIDSNQTADIADAVQNQLMLSGNIGNSIPPITNVQPETLTELTVSPQQSFAPFMDPDIGANTQVNVRASFEDVLLKYASLFLKYSERRIPKTIVDRLKRLSRYFSSFEKFEHAWAINIIRGQYWHLTNDPNFKIDPYYHPADAVLGGKEGHRNPEIAGGLMVDYNPGHWTHYGKRKYAAEIDLSGLVPGVDYRPVGRGFGAEIMVNSPEKAKVVRVVPVSVALRAHRYWHELGPQSEEELKAIWDEAQEQKEDSNEMNLPVGVGDRNNYQGISDSFLNSPSSSPGAPNASAPIDPGGTLLF